MDIGLAADKAFEKQLAVVVRSLGGVVDEPHRIHVLQTGFDGPARAGIERCSPNSSFVWHEVDTVSLGGVRSSRYPVTSLFRLLAPRLLPDLGRLLYLDADVVARHSLSELWSVDLGGRPIAAVRDAVVPWAGAPTGVPWRSLGVDPAMVYVNAGVLVMDLERFRRDRVTERAIELMELHSLAHADQCALNVLLDGDVSLLDPRWNVQGGHLLDQESLAWTVEDPEVLARAIADPSIVHFNASSLGRPWRSSCVHPRAPEWFAALDGTPFAGWRPRLADELRAQWAEPDRLGRGRARLRVAVRGLLHGDV